MKFLTKRPKGEGVFYNKNHIEPYNILLSTCYEKNYVRCEHTCRHDNSWGFYDARQAGSAS